MLCRGYNLFIVAKATVCLSGAVPSLISTSALHAPRLSVQRFHESLQSSRKHAEKSVVTPSIWRAGLRAVANKLVLAMLSTTLDVLDRARVASAGALASIANPSTSTWLRQTAGYNPRYISGCLLVHVVTRCTNFYGSLQSLCTQQQV